jgi:hypothetical protein
MVYCIEEGDSVRQLEIQARELQKLKVGDLVRYDPLECYLLNNDEFIGGLGVVVDMNPSKMDVAIMVGEQRFWCWLGDLEAVGG